MIGDNGIADKILHRKTFFMFNAGDCLWFLKRRKPVFYV